jgi:thiamine-phosphate pyrophosphorylase
MIARLRRHVVARELRRTTARVHSVRELTRALTHRPDRVLLSPMYETRTHPHWKRMPRMRAAALARLCNRNAIALGGMDDTRYTRLAPLGFAGWAGISAFRI